MTWDSKISWTHHTFNAWLGCAKVGKDCENCYAETLMDKRFHRVAWGPEGTRKRTSMANWRKPVRWDKVAKENGVKFMVFGNSLNDILEDREELVQWRADYVELIESTPNLIWMLLTKRPENWELLPSKWYAFPPPNVWFGLSVADRQTYFDRTGSFMDYFDQFAVKFLSVEPQLGPLYLSNDGHDRIGFWDWIIGGGESDQAEPGRFYDLGWGRIMMQRCQKYGIPYFHKQMGSAWARTHIIWRTTTPADRGDRAGSKPSYWPYDLVVRQVPVFTQAELERASEVLVGTRQK